MTLGEALKEMLHRAGISYKRLAEMAGLKNQSSVFNPIVRNDMKVSTLIRFAGLSGYKLVLVKSVQDPLSPEPGIELELAKEDEKQ